MLIPTGKYQTTITQARIVEVKGFETLSLCFTIDKGKHCWYNIIHTVPLSKGKLSFLQEMFAQAGYLIIIDKEHPLFVEQFIGQRFESSVDRHISDGAIKNYIIEVKRTTEAPDSDVLREKSEKHFYHSSTERDLPIL